MSYLNVYLKIYKHTIDSLINSLEELLNNNKYFEPVIKRSPSFILEKNDLDGYIIRCPVIINKDKVLIRTFGCYSFLMNKLLDEKKVIRLLEKKLKRHVDKISDIEYLKMEKLNFGEDSNSSSDDSDSTETTTINNLLDNNSDSSGLDSDEEDY